MRITVNIMENIQTKTLLVEKKQYHLEIPETSTIDDILAQFCLVRDQYSESLIISINNKIVSESLRKESGILCDSDVVSIFPPIFGG